MTHGRGRWVHVELAREVRDDAAASGRVLAALAAWARALP
jgi:hypothetical protein